MVTGQTGNRILIDGLYNCEKHPEIELYLIKGDSFPHCNLSNNHNTIWKLKDTTQEEYVESESPKPDDPNETNTDQNTKENTSEQEFSRNDSSMNSDDSIYFKKKGFFSALNSKKFPETSDYKLNAVLDSEKKNSEEQANKIKEKISERINVTKEEFENFKNLLEEKQNIKDTFRDDLQRMQKEFDEILSEIKDYYKQLREEIKELGNEKEDLISKRIEKFKTEINAIIDLYQNIEDTQNLKFKKDFDDKNIQDADKQFYYDYRDTLQESLSEVNKRVKVLEGEGLHLTISKFLISIGWIAAFVSSWFFVLWHDENNNNGGSPNLLIYVLDNLRNFALYCGPWISASVFLGYLFIILMISKYAYRWTKANKFFKERNKKEETSADKIESKIDNDNLIQYQVIANNWYEFFLKMIPFISMVLLLIIILAIGSMHINGKIAATDVPDRNMTYGELNKNLSLQVIGFLIPVAFTSLSFLYITRIIESRNIQRETLNPQSLKKSHSWEITLSIIFFFILILLLTVNQFNIPGTGLKQIGAWGFLIGSLCTGLALGYGYRYTSLHESRDMLVERIHQINHYIDRTFYPFAANYLKDNGILYRMKILYHSLLDLTESRNRTAIDMINPVFQYSKAGNNFEQSHKNDHDTSEKNSSTDARNNKKNEGAFKNFLKSVANAFYDQERSWKRKFKEKDAEIQELQDKINNLKNDSVDTNDHLYYPGFAAKIKEIKLLIEERTKRLNYLKEELEGYLKNEKTWASLTQQIENIYSKQTKLAKFIQSLELELIAEEDSINDLLNKKRIWIMEGYNLGLWFKNNSNDDNYKN